MSQACKLFTPTAFRAAVPPAVFLAVLMMLLPASAQVEVGNVKFNQAGIVATMEFAWRAGGVVKMSKPAFRGLVFYEGEEGAEVAIGGEANPEIESGRTAKTSVPSRGSQRLTVKVPRGATLHDFRVEVWVNGKLVGHRHSPRFTPQYFETKGLDKTWWIPKAADIGDDLAGTINEAIDACRDYLEKKQGANGSWKDVDNVGLAAGYTAFCAYALVKSGTPKDDPVIKKAIAFLKSSDLDMTYTIASTIMLLETVDVATHAAWIKELATKLIRWQANGTWTYEAGNGDLSNTQYGALGLWAAARAGMPIDKKVWRELGNALSKFNNPDGSFNYHIPVRRNAKSSGTIEMTAAATGLALICQRMLKGDQLSTRTLTALGPMIPKGLGWMGRGFTPEVSPYALYGIERVGSLTGQPLIGRHDWYVSGAKVLLGFQEDDGSIDEHHGGPLAGTALALLFLRRATATTVDPDYDPAYSGRSSIKEDPDDEPALDDDDADDGLNVDTPPAAPARAAVGEAVELRSTDGRALKGTIVGYGGGFVTLEVRGRKGKIPFSRLDAESRKKVEP